MMLDVPTRPLPLPSLLDCPPFDRAQGRLRQAQDVAQGAPSGASRAFFHILRADLSPPPLNRLPTWYSALT